MQEKKIMVVDDEPEVIRLVRNMLGKEGYQVIEAHSGQECLDKLRKEKPDLVLLDVIMPGMDGWEVCKRIREDERTRDTRVAMVTVKSEDKDKIKSFDESLADWHISKKYIERLPKTVKWLLEAPLKRG